MTFGKLISFALAAVALSCALAPSARADAPSTVYSLTANGKSVPVIDFSPQYDYAVLESDGPCTLEVTRRDGKPIAKFGISPMKLEIAGKSAGPTLSFAVKEPKYLIVDVDDLRKLVIAIDPIEKDRPADAGEGIYNVTRAPYAEPNATDATDAIQRAMNDAGKFAAANPGKNAVVYVPAGMYRLRELELLSNVSLYLAPGSVLRISGRREDFKIRYHKKSQNRDGTWFIYTAEGARNVRIFGRGTIDGDGKRWEKEMNLTNHVVVPMNCTGFTMDGVVVRDSGLWGTVVARSRDVTLKNTKHFNRLDMGEDDCVDICNSQDVLVQRSIAISLDDPYSTKTWAPDTDIAKSWSGEAMANRNIVFDDCLSWTRCFAFKIGAGVWRDQENITVRNGVVYDSAHAVGISHSYGPGDVRNVVFDGIDVERNTMENLGRSWARFVIDKRKAADDGGGSVYDVIVRNVMVRDAGTQAVPVQGLSGDCKIDGITFENIRMPGKTEAALTLAEIGVSGTKHAERVTIGGR